MTGKTIVARLIRIAKELSDDEVLSLYRKVKDKLEAEPKSDEHVLGGDGPGDEPMSGIDKSPVADRDNDKGSDDGTGKGDSENPTDEEVDEDINDILKSLGFLDEDGESESGSGSPKDEAAGKDKDGGGEKEASADGISDLNMYGNARVKVFRRKPVCNKAVQYTGLNADEIADFIGADNGVIKGSDFYIRTLEGDMLVSDGDWVIQGVKGEFYPCKPEIFDLTYESAYDAEGTLKAAKQGFQTSRKDKDLMADGVEGPKYRDDGRLPPRTDCRRPNGVRWNRRKDNQDPDVEGDKDLK